jgi:hypothetical protein
MSCRFRLAICATLAVLGASGLAQSAAAQSCGDIPGVTCSVFGESFAGADSLLFGETFADAPLDVVNVTPASCATGDTVTVTYRASGVATGPYPGTYEETGTYVMGPETGGPQSLREFVSFDASFTIHSGDTTITGTKEPQEPFVPGTRTALCYQFTTTTGHCGRSVVGGGNIQYEATVHGPGGSAHTTGIGGTSMFEHRFAPSCSFPNLPTSVEQCKDGMWQQYGVFKNQGDCVSYVQTGGKNPPDGP